MSENRATKQIKCCEMKQTTLKKRRTEKEEEAQIQSLATKLQHLQQHEQPAAAGPYIEENSGVGSSVIYDGSSSNKKFEVFISHRGPDTKYTLAYHMYDLLQVHGISVFLDTEELESGERFPQAIEEAIACSKVDVCILSSGYAESAWCLKELEMMMDKYEVGKSKLIPVFYDVKPSEVRGFQGAFGQGFQKQKTRYSNEVTDAWKNALGKIADISGYEGKGECCRDIVNKIVEQLDIKLLDVPTSMVGRETQLLSIKNDIMGLRQNEFGVTSVEISGIGGIGKTTFVKELYNQICSQYKRSCFIEDVSGLVEKYGVEEVHTCLIRELFKSDPTNLKMKGKKVLKDRLQNLEILVVFDNISSKVPLSTVFIEDDVSLSPRSIIIVTSREDGVLKKDPEVAQYCKNLISLKISELCFHESKQIFLKHALKETDNVNNELNEIINKMVEKCHGVPLALTLLGRQVYGRDIEFWKNLYNSIKDSLHPNFQKILKLSYSNLDTELEKCLFLDVAIFFRELKVDLLVELRRQHDDEDGKSEVLCALDKLKEKLLIDEDYGHLKMHDVLVDLGRSIVKDEHSCPGSRSRVWHPLDVQNMLFDETGTEKVKALTLVSNGLAALDKDGNPWSAEAFTALSSLEFLILHGPCIDGDLSKLPKRLLWLKWTDFPYPDIPSELSIKHVRVLEVSSQKLTQLLEHPQAEAPINLRQLKLLNCSNLQRFPDFTSKFRRLSLMEICNCDSLKIIPDNFGLLQGLKHFRVRDCHQLEQLPKTFGDLRSLVTFDLVRCRKIKSLPESFGHLPQLENLHISSCYDLEGPPESFGSLTNLVNLSVTFGNKMKFTTEHFQRLQGIHDLYISCSNDMENGNSLHGRIEAQRERQNFDGWKNSKWHCQGTGQQQLTSLVCKVSQTRKQNRNSVDFLSANAPHSMLELNVKGEWNLQEMLQCSGDFRHMEKLSLWNCYSLQRLPDSRGSLSGLKYLGLVNCLNLKVLPGNLSQLQTLYLESCWNLEELPATIGSLQNLRELSIRDCIVLKGLPSSLGNLSSLERLRVTGCWMVEFIHTHALLNLKKLTVTGCVNLRSIAGFSGLSKVENIRIEGCLNLIHIAGISRCATFSSLRRLNISGCYQLRPHPDDDGLVLQLPRHLYELQLSLNNDLLSASFDKDTKTLSKMNPEKSERRVVKAKTSPLFFPVLTEKVRDLLSTKDDSLFSFYDVCHTDDNSQHNLLHVDDIAYVAAVFCFVSAVYAVDVPMHVPPPVTSFILPEFLHAVDRAVMRFDFGEEIQMTTLSCEVPASVQVEKTNDYFVVPGAQVGKTEWYSIYEASGKDGSVIFLRSAVLAEQICNIFCSELVKQRLMSHAWTHLPSQLQFFEFSALDIAGCQITRISRHCNTCIMEEEIGLKWNRRRCLFADDHALLVLQHARRRSSSKHSFLAYPGLQSDLEAVLANLYEMSIMSSNGERILQELVSIHEQELPSALNTLLQTNASDSTLATMHRKGRLNFPKPGQDRYFHFRC